MQEHRDMMRLQEKNQRGFTFIEGMLAIAILSIGILAIAAMQVKAIQSNSSATCQGRAVQLAEDRLESLMLIPYNDVPMNPGNLHPWLEETNGDGVAGADNDDDARNDMYMHPVDGTQLYPGPADHTDPDNPINGRYNLYWNTEPTADNTVNVRIIVIWAEGSRPRRVFLDLVRGQDV